MRWEYCEHCYIDGHCENQDRGHECENYGKRMKDKCERLQKQLDIAVKALEEYANKEYWVTGYYTLNGDDFRVEKGCYCDNGYEEAQTALKEIKELDNDNQAK